MAKHGNVLQVVVSDGEEESQYEVLEQVWGRGLDPETAGQAQLKQVSTQGASHNEIAGGDQHLRGPYMGLTRGCQRGCPGSCKATKGEAVPASRGRGGEVSVEASPPVRFTGVTMPPWCQAAKQARQRSRVGWGPGCRAGQE